MRINSLFERKSGIEHAYTESHPQYNTLYYLVGKLLYNTFKS